MSSEPHIHWYDIVALEKDIILNGSFKFKEGDMFESVVSKFVKAVGRDIYLPSPSIGSSENLTPLAVVERKASRWVWGSNKYYTTEFSLSNVLMKSGAPPQVCLD